MKKFYSAFRNLLFSSTVVVCSLVAISTTSNIACILLFGQPKMPKALLDKRPE